MANLLKQTPPVTRNLIIINCIVLLAQFVLAPRGLELAEIFGLHFVMAEDFHLWQLVTYMFLHGGLSHLFFNMFALWMFGVVIERTLGQERFLLYYFICGIGAGVCQELWQVGQYFVEGLYNYDQVNFGNGTLITMDAFLNTWTTVGASGACYGVLLAFGVLYPDQRIMLLIPPIPMRAKYFVFAYAMIELVSAFTSNGNIAHFAHLGGMLFGWWLLRYWRKHPLGYGTAKSHSGPTILQRIRNIFQRREEADPMGNWRTGSTTRNADHDYNLRKKQEEERIDAILDKIRRSGYDSLTEAEKRELFQNSQR